MATVITAGNATNGLSLSADNAGTFQFKTGTGAGTTALSIDASQNVSIPKGVGGTPAFSAYLSANQSIANNTITKAQINTEEFDTASCFDTTTYRFTPNVAGYYQINVGGTISGSAATAAIVMYIYKNGSAYKLSYSTYNNQSGSGGAVVSSIVYMNGTTDYLEFYAYQQTGASQNLIGSNSTFTIFSGALVRAA